MKTKRFYSAKQLGVFAGVVNQTALNWIKSGKIRAAITPTGQYKISREDVIEFLTSHGYEIPAELAGEVTVKASRTETR